MRGRKGFCSRREKMKRFLQNFYAAALVVLCFASIAFFAFAARSYFVYPLLGALLGLLFAPLFHEAGHVFFAKIGGFSVVYAKFFCLKYNTASGGKKWSFCSPFAADETQAVPKYAGNMRRRAANYTAGGLIFGAIYLAVISVVASLFVAAAGGASEVFFVEYKQGILPFSAFRAAASFLYGMIPYGAYLLLLNAVPLIYGGGKTDGRILFEILKNKPCGVRFLAALNAQGQLFEGKSYAQIDEAYLLNLPVVAEDEPLLLLNLFSLYYAAAEKKEDGLAAEYINRISSLAPYLTEHEEKIALSELLYCNALFKDEEQAEKCFRALRGENANGEAEECDADGVCKERNVEGKIDDAVTERAFAAYYTMKGDAAQRKIYEDRARLAAEKERAAGVKLTEEKLLARLSEMEAES